MGFTIKFKVGRKRGSQYLCLETIALGSWKTIGTANFIDRGFSDSDIPFSVLCHHVVSIFVHLAIMMLQMVLQSIVPFTFSRTYGIFHRALWICSSKRTDHARYLFYVSSSQATEISIL